MKNLFTLALGYCLFGSLLLMSSCGSDGHQDDIVGSWTISAIGSTGCDDPDDNFAWDLESNNGCFIEDGVELCLTGVMTINEGGAFTFVLTVSALGFTEIETTSGTITLNDDDTVSFCPDGNCETGKCTVDNNILTITTMSDDGCTNSLTAKRS